MDVIEQFSDLMCHSTIKNWRDHVFKLGNDLGYEQILLAIFPDRDTPVEIEYAFLHTNNSIEWLNTYHAQKLVDVDPVAAHCLMKSTPLILSPEVFSTPKQKEMYEEACGYGIRSGVAMPIHGARGEMGILCFVNGAKPDKSCQQNINRSLPELSYFRDFIFESSLQFISHSNQAREYIPVTCSELECLKWSAAGKSSWEIGQILNCTEATVNFHFGNIRRKFDTSSRRQAVVKAINLGLIYTV